MTINLTVPQTMQELRPRITVVGVGGAGCNAVNNMINANLEGVDFLVANTDGQALAHSLSSRKIQLGSAITQGLGAGSKPEIGRAAAEESLTDVMSELADCNMIFITAGMGGGTGTGAAPVIARAARERGILTVGVITKPFEFEGQRRMKQAEDGIDELQAYVDTLIVIPNQNLFRLANERTTFADAFHMADAVLHQGVCGVTDLMIKPGQINLDFADIRAVMGEMGKAMMGTGEASGEARATQAAEAAINNPLLDDTTMKGANAVLINITGGLDMTLFEVDEAANRIRKEVDTDATIIFGSAFDDKLDGVMRVSVVATGINSNAHSICHPGTIPSKTETIKSRSSVIVPNPPESFSAPSHDLSSELLVESRGTMITDTPANGDPNTLSEGTWNDRQADMPPEWDASAKDLDNQLNNEMANAAISEIIDTSENDSAPIEARMPNNNPAPKAPTEDTKSDRKNFASQVTVGDAPMMPLTSSDDKKAPNKAHFIPNATTDIPDEETVVKLTETPLRRPSSLINRISGLWTSKPNSEKDQPMSESSPKPVLDEAASKDQIAVSILDLSQPGIGSQDDKGRPKTAQNLDDGELDIPAFLRRQAN
ncbi:cell division protein FtsZ [Candidatus Puniceispirillum sp.]|nr:cell division protein FtsZ [Candidatus Puniceispirillum sp.]